MHPLCHFSWDTATTLKINKENGNNRSLFVYHIGEVASFYSSTPLNTFACFPIKKKTTTEIWSKKKRLQQQDVCCQLPIRVSSARISEMVEGIQSRKASYSWSTPLLSFSYSDTSHLSSCSHHYVIQITCICFAVKRHPLVPFLINIAVDGKVSEGLSDFFLLVFHLVIIWWLYLSD